MNYVNIRNRFGGGKKNLAICPGVIADTIHSVICTPFQLFLSEKTGTAGVACFLCAKNLEWDGRTAG